MKQKSLVLIVLGLLTVLLLAGCTQSGYVTKPASDSPPAGTAAPTQATVTITANGYEPKTVTIAKGGTVTWVNNTDTPNWPASAKHPTHEVYPGSSITKCGTAEQSTIFDACKGLGKGESYSFTFNNAGEWAYHNHVNAKQFGKVIVTE